MGEVPTKEVIRVPVSHKAREITRAVIEALAGLIPGGGSLARLYRTTGRP